MGNDLCLAAVGRAGGHGRRQVAAILQRRATPERAALKPIIRNGS